MADSQAAFSALVELATRSRSAAKGLPAQGDVQQLWSGIGFVLLGHRFVAPMGEISELLEVPIYTKLPGVQPWVLGVANVRGRLLPLFDMGVYFGAQLDGHQKKRHRVLVLEREGLYSGLIVDAALGMQYFPVDTFDPAKKDLDEHFHSLVEGSYRKQPSSADDGKQWYVFSPRNLVDEPRFVNAAA